MTFTREDEVKYHFDGSNWEDLDRMIGLAKFQFLQDSEYDDDAPKRCAYLAGRFQGPALDWAVQLQSSNPAIFENFDGFIVAVKEAFGIEQNNIGALRRKALDELRWSDSTPVFFAEFDRLTFSLGITGHQTKIAMVQAKLPVSLKAELARQALDFANYDTMRERLNTMWALDPHRSSGSAAKKPRCGSCGKRGHLAADCKAKN